MARCIDEWGPSGQQQRWHAGPGGQRLREAGLLARVSWAERGGAGARGREVCARGKEEEKGGEGYGCRLKDGEGEKEKENLFKFSDSANLFKFKRSLNSNHPTLFLHSSKNVTTSVGNRGTKMCIKVPLFHPST